MANQASQRFVADLKTLATDTQELIKATAEQSGEKIVAARERAVMGLSRAQAAVAEHAKEMARTADGYVHEHPWTTVGVVALFAFTIGFMAGRR